MISNPHYGPDEDELNGIELVDRKRMRGGPDSYEVMDIAGGLNKGIIRSNNSGLKDDVLSELDCPTSSYSVLAELAMQASQQP